MPNTRAKTTAKAPNTLPTMVAISEPLASPSPASVKNSNVRKLFLTSENVTDVAREKRTNWK